MNVRLAAFGVAFLLAVSSFAQQSPIVADRPGLADGSSTVGAGTAQVEFGVTHEDDGESVLSLPALLRYGFTDAFELRVESGILERSSGENEWQPVAVGFKWRMRDGDVPLSLLASVQPTDDVEGSVRLVSDIELGGGFSLTPNVGLALAEGDGPAFVVAASLERGVGNTVPFIDFEIESGDGDASMIVDGGVAWIVNDDTQLDLSGGARVTGDAYPDWFVSAGISRRF